MLKAFGMNNIFVETDKNFFRILWLKLKWDFFLGMLKYLLTLLIMLMSP